jgi:hypothetical protein
VIDLHRIHDQLPLLGAIAGTVAGFFISKYALGVRPLLGDFKEYKIGRAVCGAGLGVGLILGWLLQLLWDRLGGPGIW